MAQYDLIFIKNTSSSGLEFAEQVLAKPSSAGLFLTQDASSGMLAWSKVFDSPTINGTIAGTALVTNLDAAPAAGKIPDALTVFNKLNGMLAANDAMIFKGTLGSGGTFTALPTTHNAGWTFRVITPGTYAGNVCEQNDLIMAVVGRTGTGNQNSDWTVSQANIDGAVTSNLSSSVANRLALFADTSGKRITQSDFTTASMVLKNTLAADLVGNVWATLPQSGAQVNTITTVAGRTGAVTLAKSDVGLDNVENKSSLAIRQEITIDASGKIVGIGTGNVVVDNTKIVAANIPELSADKITTGTFSAARIPSLSSSKISDFSTTVLNTAISAYKGETTLGGVLNTIASNVVSLETFSSESSVKRVSSAPVSATAAGTLNEVYFDSNYIYVCVVGGAAGTARWKRSAVAAW